MIDVRLIQSGAGREIRLTVTGHAARRGKTSIPCACVSYTAYQAWAVLEEARFGGFCLIDKCSLDKGSSELHAVFTDDESYRAALERLEAVRAGLRILGKKYPDEVRVAFE